jgi:hypothetical protein
MPLRHGESTKKVFPDPGTINGGKVIDAVLA